MFTFGEESNNPHETMEWGKWEMTFQRIIHQLKRSGLGWKSGWKSWRPVIGLETLVSSRCFKRIAIPLKHGWKRNTSLNLSQILLFIEFSGWFQIKDFSSQVEIFSLIHAQSLLLSNHQTIQSLSIHFKLMLFHKCTCWWGRHRGVLSWAVFTSSIDFWRGRLHLTMACL